MEERAIAAFQDPERALENVTWELGIYTHRPYFIKARRIIAGLNGWVPTWRGYKFMEAKAQHLAKRGPS